MRGTFSQPPENRSSSPAAFFPSAHPSLFARLNQTTAFYPEARWESSAYFASRAEFAGPSPLNALGRCGLVWIQSWQKPVIVCTTGVPQRRSRWAKMLRRRQITLRRRHLKLPSQCSFSWTGGPPSHRSFVLRGLLRSPGSSRRLGFLIESQSYRPSPLLCTAICLAFPIVDAQ